VPNVNKEMEDDSEPDPIESFKCSYCSHKVGRDEGCSRWESGLHYVVLKCGCGKENWIRVDLDGFNPGEMFEKEPKIISAQRKVKEKELSFS